LDLENFATYTDRRRVSAI